MAIAATKQTRASVAILTRSRRLPSASVASSTGTIANTPEYLTAVAAPAMAPAAANSPERGSPRHRSDRYNAATAPSTITGSHRHSVVVSIDSGTIATTRPAIRPAPDPARLRPAKAVKATVAAATKRFATRAGPTNASTGSRAANG